MIKEIIRFLKHLFQSDEERSRARVAEIFNTQALARHPELAQEAARIEQARRQASAILPMIRDALIAPENTAAERRYGKALKQAGASASTGSEMRRAGQLEQISNLMNASQRGTVAWAKQVAARHGVKGSKYASGADAFADNAEWGALLEDLIPQLPKPVRQAMAVPMDLFIDPLAGVSPAKAYDLAMDAIYKLSPDIGSVITNLGVLTKAKLSQLLNPSFYKYAQTVHKHQSPKIKIQPPTNTIDDRQVMREIIEMIKRKYPPEQQREQIALLKQMFKKSHEIYKRRNKPIKRLKQAIEEAADDQIRILQLMDEVEGNIPRRLTALETDPTSIPETLRGVLEEMWFDLSPKEFMPLLDPETNDFVLRKLAQERAVRRARTGDASIPLYHKQAPDIKTISTAEIIRRLKALMLPETKAEEIYNNLARTRMAHAANQALNKLAQFLSNEPLSEVFGRQRWIYDWPKQSETIEKLARIIPFIRGFYPVAPHLARGAWENPYRFIMLSRILNRTNTGEFGQSE